MDIIAYNQFAWDKQVEKKDKWTIPVSDEEIAEARRGNWKVVLTPHKPVPFDWFPSLKGLYVLGLASGGGQQGPILAAAGANVTIFDNSSMQLKQDELVSTRHGLGIHLVQGDMRDLSVFPDNHFDMIFNPCSLLFVDDIRKVWKECYRILKPNGILMSGLLNPITYQIDEDNLVLTYKQPYSDLHSLPKEKLEAFTSTNEPLLFGHSLTDQIGGQLEAGFALTAFYEDDWNGTHKLDSYFPAFFATRAIKLI